MGNKNAFWQALVFTIVVFGLGLVLGFFLEVRQGDDILNQILESEINILDDNLRTRVINNFDVDCDVSRESLFSFADKIYLEAVELEEIDGDGRLKDLNILHKRYDALRMLLWLESEELRERCGGSFHTIVYLYEYNSEDTEIKGKQIFYSRLLFDLKSKFPDEIILIPIAVDTGLESVNLAAEVKGIEKFPVVILDNDEYVDDIITLGELEDKIFQNRRIRTTINLN